MDELLDKVKQNLILAHCEDDMLLLSFIASAVSYAESFQHLDEGYYETHNLSPHTMQAVIMLASYFYESRDGSTGGFFADNTNAADNVWRAVNRLLVLDREWKI